jgi:hypothetical protein
LFLSFLLLSAYSRALFGPKASACREGNRDRVADPMVPQLAPVRDAPIAASSAIAAKGRK